VKKELSRRYYQHYLSIINDPEDRPQAAAIPVQELKPSPERAAAADKDAPAAGQAHVGKDKNGPPTESLPFEEDLAGIAEVAPFQPAPPSPQERAPAPAEPTTSAKTAKRRFCFIATAAFGSPLAREVVLLQDFRDKRLAGKSLGEKFIQAYYRVSPYLAKQISRHAILKLLTRLLLLPLIHTVKKLK